MMECGNEIVMTKGAAIEATAVLSLAFPKTTERLLGRKTADKASEYLRLCSTVRDALAASSVGIRGEGVTSMHDATEGGVLGGLYELARSSGHTLAVENERLHVSEESAAVCAAFGLDPLVTLSEGALLLTCRPDRTDEVLRRLSRQKVRGYPIGKVGERKRGALLLSGKGATKTYVPPRFDPYWEVYARGVENGWK